MDNNYNEELLEYKVEIVLLFILIIVVVVAITVVYDLTLIKLNYDKYGYIQNKVKAKARFTSIIILFISLYFLYLTYKQYKNNSTQSNFNFLIVAILVSIAAIIRYLTIIKEDTIIEGAQDIIF